MLGLSRLMRRFKRQRCPECRRVTTQQTFCDVCGYDLIRNTREKAFISRL